MVLDSDSNPSVSFFFNDTATTKIHTVSDTLPLHDALPISRFMAPTRRPRSRLDCRLTTWTARSEEHTSELQSPDTNSYAVFCLKKTKLFRANNHCLQRYRNAATLSAASVV